MAGIVSKAAAALRNSEATAQELVDALADHDSRIEAVRERRRHVEEAKNDRADKATARVIATRGPGIRAAVLAIFKTGRAPRLDELEDTDLLEAILANLEEGRPRLAEDVAQAPVTLQAARDELLRAQTFEAVARVTAGLAGLVEPVRHAAELLSSSRGLFAMGRTPGVVSPADSNGEFAAVLGDALSAPKAWQDRVRAELEPFLDELRASRESKEVVNA